MEIPKKPRITTIILILLLNSSILSATRSINTNGPEPPLQFNHDLPPYVLVNPSKGAIFLDCVVTMKADKDFLQDHLLTNFNVDEEVLNTGQKTDDEEEEDETFAEVDQEEIRKQYLEQMNAQKLAESFKKDNEETVDGATFIDRSRVRRNTDNSGELIYSWLRDGELLVSTSVEPSEELNGYKLFFNGTLKIKMSNQTAGHYRCLVKHSKYNIGTIITREVVVEEPDFVKVNTTPIVFDGIVGESLVIICPITSLPAANVSWYSNNSIIAFNSNVFKKENRFFLLANGSLLLTNAQQSDSGKYRCNATNSFHKKRFRSANMSLSITPIEPSAKNVGKFKLLPPLQSTSIKIPSGNTLILYCATTNSSKVSWSFTPSSGKIPIQLGSFLNLKYSNVSVGKHDGVYNCSINDNEDGEFQLFEVTVLTPPTFYQKIESVTLPVAGTVSFNCSASGNPKPNVEWYRNGKLIKNNFVRYSKDGVLRIESVEPDDEGIYQCFAGNGHGVITMSNYLLVLKKTLLASPKNIHCYPMDNNSMLVTFDTANGQSVDVVNYFIATESSWSAPNPIQMENNEKVFIFHSDLKVLTPFRLFVRGFSMLADQNFAMSHLSNGRDCSTQGIEPRFIKSSNGIFLWWPAPEVQVTSFIIQFWYNGTSSKSNQIILKDEAVCSFHPWIGSHILFSEVSNTLQKIPIFTKTHPSADTSENVTITEVRVPGNASGILIPNTEQIVVRILGTVQANGELMMDQDLKYLSWNTIDSSSTKIQHQEGLLEVVKTESRSITVTWSGFNEKNDLDLCLEICHLPVLQFIDRGAPRSLNCMSIPNGSKFSTIRNLKPKTWYDIFLQVCGTSEPVSKTINVGTSQDVPGPVVEVTGHQNSGILIKWKPPKNPNGNIFYYLLEWRNPRHNETVQMMNVTGTEFQFPDTLNEDRFNVTIRAVGVAGMGNPHYVNLQKAMQEYSGLLGRSGRSRNEIAFWNKKDFPFIVLLFFLVLVIVGVIIFGVMWNHRQCKKNETNPQMPSNGMVMTTAAASTRGNGMIKPEEQEMMEMQTLINRTEPPLILLVPNGKPRSLIQLEGDDDEGSEQMPNDDHRILMTSTPTDDQLSEIITLATSNYESDELSNAFFSTFQPSESPNVIANGNSSQIISQVPSVYEKSQQKLHNNNTLCLDRQKVGKASSIETDNEEEDEEEEEDDDENDADADNMELNLSNLSSKPLHAHATQHSWNFRRPLVGPNG